MRVCLEPGILIALIRKGKDALAKLQKSLAVGERITTPRNASELFEDMHLSEKVAENLSAIRGILELLEFLAFLYNAQSIMPTFIPNLKRVER